MLSQSSRSYYNQRSEQWLKALWEKAKSNSQHDLAARFRLECAHLPPGKDLFVYNPKEACDRFEAFVSENSGDQHGLPAASKGDGSEVEHDAAAAGEVPPPSEVAHGEAAGAKVANADDDATMADPSEAVLDGAAGGKAVESTMAAPCEAVLGGAAGAEAVESTMAAPSEAVVGGAAGAEAVESTMVAPSEAVLGGAAGAEVLESTMAAPPEAVLDCAAGAEAVESTMAAPPEAVLDGAAGAEAVESTMAAPSEAVLDGATGAEVVESTMAAPSEAVLDGATGAEAVESTMAAPSEAVLGGAGGAEAVESTMAAPSEVVLDDAAGAEAVESTMAAPSEAVLGGATVAEVADAEVTTALDGCDSKVPAQDPEVTMADPPAPVTAAAADADMADACETSDVAIETPDTTDLFGGSNDAAPSEVANGAAAAEVGSGDDDPIAEGQELIDAAVCACRVHSAYDAYLAHVREQEGLSEEEWAFGDDDGDPLADVQGFASFLETQQESPIPEVEAAVHWWFLHLDAGEKDGVANNHDDSGFWILNK